MTDREHPVRCRPAHHPPVECFNQPVVVFVTVCTKSRQPVLASDETHGLCREIWHAADFWHVGRYVIMPDHIHLFCGPGRIPMPSLRQWVEFWKSRVAAQFQKGKMDATEGVPPGGGMRIGGGPASVRAGSGTNPDGTVLVQPDGRKETKLWQRDYWDTQIRSRMHYDEKWSYVRMNPMRKGLVQVPDHWPFQGEVDPLAWR